VAAILSNEARALGRRIFAATVLSSSAFSRSSLSRRSSLCPVPFRALWGEDQTRQGPPQPATLRFRFRGSFTSIVRELSSRSRGGVHVLLGLSPAPMMRRASAKATRRRVLERSSLRRRQQVQGRALFFRAGAGACPKPQLSCLGARLRGPGRAEPPVSRLPHGAGSI
jgi:hypothetical protein